jgi:hypothetical protein
MFNQTKLSYDRVQFSLQSVHTNKGPYLKARPCSSERELLWRPDSGRNIHSADPSDSKVYVMNRIRPPAHWDRGFDPHSRHIYSCVLCVCVSLCIETLRWG